MENMQLQIDNISSGVDFGQETQQTAFFESTATTVETAQPAQQEDVKPNRAELDQLLKIATVSSGVEMETDANEDQEEDQQQDDPQLNESTEAAVAIHAER